MATVTGLTAARMEAIEDASVVSGAIDGSGDLILTTFGGTDINAGTVLGNLVDASTTVKGIVELATDAETITGTDAVRAVTPASLAAGIAAIPGYRIQLIDEPTETAALSTYPFGLSLSKVTAGVTWGDDGTILTGRFSNDRGFQVFYQAKGGTNVPDVWLRTSHTSNGGGGWTLWKEFATEDDIDALDTRVDTLEATDISLDSRLDAAEATISSHTSTLSSHTTSISSYGTRLNTIEAQLAKLPGAMASGTILITPVANTPTGAAVTFPVGRFGSTPRITVSAQTGSPGSVFLEVSINNPTSSGFDAVIYRTNTTATTINWVASL